MPQSGEDGILYLVPQGNDRFIEYYYSNDEWIQLGSSVFDYTVDSTLSNNSTNTIQNSTIKNALDSKLNANQVVNALNDSSNETPQSGVLYNSLGAKLDSEEISIIPNNNIDKLFLADFDAYYDFEIKIPYDSKVVTLVGSYADTGDETVYNHYTNQWNVMERFKFAGLTPKSFSNPSSTRVDIIFEDAQGNEYEAEVTTTTESLTSGGDKYWPITAFDGYSNTKSSFGNFWCFSTTQYNNGQQNDLTIKIHFTDAFKLNEKFNFSFYTSGSVNGSAQVAGSPRLEYVKVRSSTDLENYTDIVNLQNVWVSDYFKYNQHISEYSVDRENSKWVFNLF